MKLGEENVEYIKAMFVAILFPPPHSPVGLQWTEFPGGCFRIGGLIFRWSPVDSTWTTLHKVCKKAKYPVHWTPPRLDYIKRQSTQSSGLQWTGPHKIHKKAKYPVQWSSLDWTT